MTADGRSGSTRSTPPMSEVDVVLFNLELEDEQSRWPHRMRNEEFDIAPRAPMHTPNPPWVENVPRETDD